ncbi:MAG: hypothetical protein MUE85_21820 [Microscillaceae bacterium]|jgi:hypothetical protein|nr:hypothetical protein [Microscillaceae bacterium]
MRELLDYFFASTTLMVIMILVITTLGMLLAFSNPFRSKSANKLLWVLGIGVGLLGFFLPILNGAFWGYGLAVRFKDITTDKDWVCLLDERIMGSEDSYYFYRIYILEKKTGKLLHRQSLSLDSDAKLLGQKGQILFYQVHKNFVFWDIVNHTTLQTLNKESLPNIYPQLAAGVERIQYATQDSTLEVAAKTGKNYTIVPYTLALLDKTQKTKKKPIAGVYYADDSRIYQNGSQYADKILEITAMPENYKIKQLTRNNQAINPPLTFLEGRFLAISNDAKACIVLSYETTDKENFLLSGLSLEGKLLWQIKQSELPTQDSYSQEPQLNVALMEGKNLIFTVGGYVLSLNCLNGQLNWKVRL